MSEDKINKSEMLSKLQNSPELFIIYSTATKCPYVVCDPETADDFVSVYFTETEAKMAWGILHSEKIPVNIVKLENKHFLLFYTSLYTMGINALAVTINGSRFLVQLEDVVKRSKPENLPEGTVWVENPEMHLTALYLMQEVRKAPGQQMSRAHQEMLEEIVAHFSKGKFIQPIREEQKSIPLLKLANEEKYQPIFSDILEFQKFNKDNQFKPLVIEASKIAQLLVAEAVGVVINPLGVNLPLKITRQQTPPAPAAPAEADA